MTERTHTHPQAGPILFDAVTRAAGIHVTTADISHATVTISTEATSGPAHDAVQNAGLTGRTGCLGVTLRDEGVGGGVNINSNGGVFISGNNYGSSISTGRAGVTNIRATGRVIVNGVDVTDAVKAGGAADQNATITVRATLPIGSSIDLRSTSADIDVAGEIASAAVRTTSGDIEIGYAQAANLTSVSGDINLISAGTAQATTTSGDIEIDAVGAVTATSISGDVRVRNTSGLGRLSTTSGDIAVGYCGPVEPVTRTVSGKVRARRLAARGAAA